MPQVYLSKQVSRAPAKPGGYFPGSQPTPHSGLWLVTGLLFHPSGFFLPWAERSLTVSGVSLYASASPLLVTRSFPPCPCALHCARLSANDTSSPDLPCLSHPENEFIFEFLPRHLRRGGKHDMWLKQWTDGLLPSYSEVLAPQRHWVLGPHPTKLGPTP